MLRHTFFKHPLRIAWRGLGLCGVFLLAALDYAVSVAFSKASSKPAQRADWLHRHSQRVLRVLRVDLQMSGPVPQRGLLVCNHLGYLDILVIAAITPAAFVAKSEVKHWPILGWFAQKAGSIFIQRDQRSDVSRSTDAMTRALAGPTLIVLFAEGTSSDGKTVLPFKSSLLEPATKGTHPLHVGHINYVLADGDVAEEVCYWRDMTLFPHLVNLLGKRQISARVKFAAVREIDTDRKTLAQSLHAAVLRLKDASLDCKELSPAPTHPVNANTKHIPEDFSKTIYQS